MTTVLNDLVTRASFSMQLPRVYAELKLNLLLYMLACTQLKILCEQARNKIDRFFLFVLAVEKVSPYPVRLQIASRHFVASDRRRVTVIYRSPFNQGKEIYFIKLHAPLETLQSKAEDMKLKLPFSLLSKNPAMDVAISSLPFTVRDDLSSHNHRYFLLTPFVKQHAEKFMAKGECFSPLDRIAVVDWILNETRFSEEEFGVKRLVNQQVFKAVYPPRESGENVSEKHTKGTYGLE